MKVSQDSETMERLYHEAIRLAGKDFAEECYIFGNTDLAGESLDRLEQLVEYIGNRRFRNRLAQLQRLSKTDTAP